jgi:hypothetical protein
MLCAVLAVIPGPGFLSMLLSILIGVRLVSRLDGAEWRLDQIHDLSVPSWMNEKDKHARLSR